jgi:hypothetical protein
VGSPVSKAAHAVAEAASSFVLGIDENFDVDLGEFLLQHLLEMLGEAIVLTKGGFPALSPSLVSGLLIHYK